MEDVRRVSLGINLAGCSIIRSIVTVTDFDEYSLLWYVMLCVGSYEWL